jgi:hypothetical protein
MVEQFFGTALNATTVTCSWNDGSPLTGYGFTMSLKVLKNKKGCQRQGKGIIRLH